MRSYIVKENHINSAVSEILQYKEILGHPVTFLQEYSFTNSLLPAKYFLLGTRHENYITVRDLAIGQWKLFNFPQKVLIYIQFV